MKNLIGLIQVRQFLKYQGGYQVQPVKYWQDEFFIVEKSGLIGLARFIAIYWVNKNIRCKTIFPGGVKNGKKKSFYL